MLTLVQNFYVPFMREVLLLHGICNCARKTCLNLLSKCAAEILLNIAWQAMHMLLASRFHGCRWMASDGWPVKDDQSKQTRIGRSKAVRHLFCAGRGPVLVSMQGERQRDRAVRGRGEGGAAGGARNL